MYIFHNMVINTFILLRVLIFITLMEQVIAGHHRIVINDRLPAKENKHKSTRIPKIKTTERYNFDEDEILPTTTEDYYDTNNRNKHFVDKTRRLKSRTTPTAINFADLIEITTPFSQKLSVPIYESIFDQYYTQHINSHDLQTANSYNQLTSIHINKLPPHKEEIKNYRKIYSHPYEVHEEIQEDIHTTPPVTSYYNTTKNAKIIYYNHKYT